MWNNLLGQNLHLLLVVESGIEHKHTCPSIDDSQQALYALLRPSSNRNLDRPVGRHAVVVPEVLCHPAVSPALIVVNGNVNPLGNWKSLRVAALFFQGTDQDVPLGFELLS